VLARPVVAATVLLGLLVAVMYGPPIFDSGWYYDDWAIGSAMADDPAGGPVDLYRQCHAVDSGNRPGACAFHAVRFWLLGMHVRRYHALAALLVLLCALAFFALLRRCRLPIWAAGASAAVFVVFPGSDSTRLWPTASNLAWALLLWLVGALVALRALDRGGLRAAVLHGASVVCMVAAMLTYDGMIPIVAMTGAVYLLARRDRAALALGAVDLVVAAAYGVWRMWIVNIPDAAGLTLHRTRSQLIAREGHLIEAGWKTFKTLFLPGGTVALVLWVAGALVVLAAMAFRPAARRAIAWWIAIAAGCAAFAAISLSAYVTANDLYLPDPGSLFNRLNVAAALAYCLGFVALLSAIGVALRSLLAVRRSANIGSVLAAGAIVAAGLAVVIHQYDFSRDTQAAYKRSWTSQIVAMRRVQIALSTIPSRDATIVSFGHPLYEPGYIPVFAADWDLRGAIDDLTDHDPPLAAPWAGFTCGDDAVMRGTERWAPYKGTSPVWFVDAATTGARRIKTRADCEQATQQLTPVSAFDVAG
jgi:hypothetical protein